MIIYVDKTVPFNNGTMESDCGIGYAATMAEAKEMINREYIGDKIRYKNKAEYGIYNIYEEVNGNELEELETFCYEF